MVTLEVVISTLELESVLDWAEMVEVLMAELLAVLVAVTGLVAMLLVVL